MARRLRLHGLTFVSLLLVGCSSTVTPSGPTPEELAAEEAAREETRRQQIEIFRDDFIGRADAAKAEVEADPTPKKLSAYLKVLEGYKGLPTEVREEIDFDAYCDDLMAQSSAMLEPLQATWKNKKSRTLELKTQIKDIYAVRMGLLRLRDAEPSEYLSDGTQMFALGSDEPGWDIGANVLLMDLKLLMAVEPAGRSAVHEVCKAALDLAIAEDKKDLARQHYIMQVCTYNGGREWEADLLAWAPGKTAKAFIKVYGPIQAEQRSAHADAEAERDAEERRRRAELEDQRADAQGGGSTSSSSSSSGPSAVSVTLRNSCGSGIKMFFGDDPKFGSGRTDSLNSNSRTNKSLKVGDKVWLVDGSGNPLGSVTVSASMREIEFSCSGVSGR